MLANVACWPETEVLRRPRFGRYRGVSGLGADIAETIVVDPAERATASSFEPARDAIIKDLAAVVIT